MWGRVRVNGDATAQSREGADLMSWSQPDTGVAGRSFRRALLGVDWLRLHRTVVLALAAAGIALACTLDLLIPGYAIAGFYLLPLLLVTFALRERWAVIAVSAVCLALTVYVLVLQGRTNAQNILLVAFGALAGAGLIALGSLYNRYDRLYERERTITARLHSLTTQVQRLQEISVLDSELPLSGLLLDIVTQARQLLAADGGGLYRFEEGDDAPRLVAAVDLTDERAAAIAAELRDGALERAVAARRPLGSPHLLLLPLAVRSDTFGAIALPYDRGVSFSVDDLGLASSFADQAALAIENARLREQVERSAVVAERSRLARELHDSVTQSLFAASLTAEALLKAPDCTSPVSREGLIDVQRLTRGALAEMRTMLMEMRPGALGQSPLADLLDHVTQATQARTRMAVELTLGHAPPLPADVTIALYRIAQEAMNNVVRHSRAERAWIALDGSGTQVRLVIGDDGCGFDPAAVGPEQLGLRIMGERAEAVEASLEVASAAGGGTLVTACWPSERG
jgi:signal transduction histidine kinase